MEPAYANIVEEEGSDVHGVAFCMTLESVAKLDNQERGYNKKMVKTLTYNNSIVLIQNVHSFTVRTVKLGYNEQLGTDQIC